MDTILGVVLTSDTRIASKIWGIGVFDIEATPFEVAVCNPSHHAQAVDLLNGATKLVVPNSWTIDTLRRLTAVDTRLLDQAIDLLEMSRRLDRQYGQHSLAACARRLGTVRLLYAGSDVLTRRALDACRRDAEIVYRLYHHLEHRAHILAPEVFA